MLTIRRYQLARPGDVDAARHTAQQPEEEPPPETPVAKDGPGQQWTIGRLSSLGNQQTWGAQSVKSIMRQSSEVSAERRQVCESELRVRRQQPVLGYDGSLTPYSP